MIPFESTDWQSIEPTEYNGETGHAIWKTIQYDKIRVRLIEYSPNYRADHWCDKGHILYCVKGEFMSHLKDGSTHLLTKGMSYQTTDNKENPHLSTSKIGCTLFVVDGDFLKA